MVELQINNPPRISICEVGWRFETTLSDYDLWYVSSGSGTSTVNGIDYFLSPSICVIMPPGAKIRAIQDPQKRLTVFHVHFLLEPAMQLPVHTTISNSTLLDELSKKCVTSYKKISKTGWNEAGLCLKQIVLQILNDSENRNFPKKDLTIENLMAEIRKEPGRTWNVNILARKANLSRAQFNRRFAKFAGVHPGKFIIQEKVKRSIELLKQSGLNISEVAEIMGYNDVFYFSKQIKRETGHNPSYFKK